jgi:hypothetical protein
LIRATPDASLRSRKRIWRRSWAFPLKRKSLSYRSEGRCAWGIA